LTIAAIMRHGCGLHGARTVTTATADGYRQTSYRELGQQAARLDGSGRTPAVTADADDDLDEDRAAIAVRAVAAILATATSSRPAAR